MNFRFSPAKELKAIFFCNDLKHTHSESSLKIILWKKEHTNAIISCMSHVNPKLFGFFFEKGMRNLCKNTYAVTDFATGILTGSVLKLFNYGKSIIQNLIVSMAINIYDSTDTTCIMFHLPKLFLTKITIVTLVYL